VKTSHSQLANLIWKVADKLRGTYKQSEYGRVILPFTVLRRMDYVMEPTRELVWEKDAAYNFPDKDQLICDQIGVRFFNRSKQSFKTIGAAPNNVLTNLEDYLRGFSAAGKEIFEKFDFHRQLVRLNNAGLLYLVFQEFAGFPLRPTEVDNHGMGLIFEELIRKFADASNETAGEHFTPREVIELMVNLLLAPDLGRFTLKALAETKAFTTYAEGSLLIEAFKPLIGTAWPTRAEARKALLVAAAEGGVIWPGATIDKAIWSVVAVTDPEGEIQTKKGEPLPDLDLRDYENVPLKKDIDEYFEREVRPHVPG
jgi:hypothetical protein